MHTEEEHKYFEDLVVKGALLIYSNRNETEDSLISTLTGEFGNSLTARMIYYFLPITFGWVLLKRLGVESFPDHFILLDKNRNAVEFKVSGQSIFIASLTLAYGIFEHGYTEKMTQEVVTELINRSSEVDAANKALNAGDDIKGGQLQPTIIYSIMAEELLVNGEQ